ncbi:MAG: galactokinase [Tenacibaculum sp.]
MNTILTKKVNTKFIETFNCHPEVLVFSPGRINLIGEHIDYNGGVVLPAAIDKGIVAALSKNSKTVSSVLALDKNEYLEISSNNIYPMENGQWGNYILGIIAEINKREKRIDSFNLIFSGNIPMGAGLSSSAALENSVVFGLNELFNLGFTKSEMTLISQQAEHNFVGVRCGIMDQYASMFGQENSVLLLDCKSLKLKPYLVNFNEYEIVLFNTNVRHNLVESAYNACRLACEKVASLLRVDALRDASESDLIAVKNKINHQDYLKALYVIEEISRVKKAVKAIKDNELQLLGELLFLSHDGLQNQYKVSCPELDFLVASAKKSPAVIGARMMGAGFGGCTINLVKKEQKDGFISSVSKLYQTKFAVEFNVIFVKLVMGTHLI